MKIKKPAKLPESKPIGEAGNARCLAAILKKAAGKNTSPFCFRAVVKGFSVSCRLISHTRIKGFGNLVCLQGPLSAADMAETFFDQYLLEHARHGDMPEGDGWVKGWSVSKAVVDEKTMVIVTATWVQNRKSR